MKTMVNYEMYQSVRLSKVIGCQAHNNKPIENICTSPACNNYRQLCEECLLQDRHHSQTHISREEAFEDVKSDIDTVFKGLKVLRKKILHTMDTKLNNHNILKQIEEKLDEIKKVLNSKIDNFHAELRKIYNNNIREKLNKLFLIVEKSYEFLQQEKINLYKNEKLKPFFINDLSHDLRHYESYYEQILEKNVRKFKAGWEHDKVMKLVVSFEQNLAQIFKFNSQVELKHEPHIFVVNSRSEHLYKIENGNEKKVEVKILDRVIENGQFNILPSVYYSQTDSYYLFGEVKKESNKIWIFQLESEVKRLEIKLETKRVNFDVCLFNEEIFIVGGENEREGCLIKCEKFIPSEGKTYIINSLNQRSAKHKLFPYKDKFILKIGGTSFISNQNWHAITPEIYLPETEDWRMIELQIADPRMRINFGLWPGILFSESANKIIILEGETGKRKSFKERYDLTIGQNSKDLKEIKLTKSIFALNTRNKIYSNCCYENQDGRILIATSDEKSSFNFLHFNI